MCSPWHLRSGPGAGQPEVAINDRVRHVMGLVGCSFVAALQVECTPVVLGNERIDE
jgi:hypothetical protein